MATTVVPAKSALTAAIAAISSLATALVREGLPTEEPSRSQSERVYVYRRVEGGTRTPLIEQPGVVREVYNVPVLIEVQTYGNTDDGATGEARAYEILDEMIDAIDTNYTLDGAVGDAAVESWDSDTAPTEDGWITKILASVQAGALV